MFQARIFVQFYFLSLIYKIIHNISGFDRLLGVAEQYENIFNFEEPIIIRTLPQYSKYHGLYYNGILKNIDSGETLQNGRLIKIGKEYRVLSIN